MFWNTCTYLDLLLDVSCKSVTQFSNKHHLHLFPAAKQSIPYCYSPVSFPTANHPLAFLLQIKYIAFDNAAGGYNPDDYEELPASQDVQDLFQYILHYKPDVAQLETPLKPFIPDYTPAIGDIDEFIKVHPALSYSVGGTSCIQAPI